MASKKSGQKCQNELNFTSSSFNALLALYNKNLQPPLPNARIFNNICEYAMSLKERKIREKDYNIAARLKNIAENRVSKIRNRKRDPSKLEHLMKVKSQTDGIVEKVTMMENAKRKGRQMNVLERMEVKHKEGPLSVLYNSIEKKERLKVWTRKLKGLRGVSVGYLVAFDKHMNLAMMDVDEMFAIEEEVIVDPDEEMKKSLTRNERKRERKRGWRRKKRERLRQDRQGKVGTLSVEMIKEGNRFKDSECSSISTTGESFDYQTKAGNCSTPLLDSNTDDKEDSCRNDVGQETQSSTDEVVLGENKGTTTNMNLSNSDLTTNDERCKIVSKDIDFVDENLEQKQDELCQIEIVKNENKEDLENYLQRPECSRSDNEPSNVEVKEVFFDEKGTGDSTSSFLEKNLTRYISRDGANDDDQTREAFCSGDHGGMELAKEEKDAKQTSATRDVECEDDVFGKDMTSNQVTICDILDEVKGTENELKKAETLLPNDKNYDTNVYKASAVLESNVLAMEFDEGSQDSTVFDGAVSRERSALLETVTLHHSITYGTEEYAGVMKELCEEVAGDDMNSDYEVDGRDGDKREDGTAISVVGEEENRSQVDLSNDNDTEDNKEMSDSLMTEDSEGMVEHNEGVVKGNKGMVKNNDGNVEENEEIVKDASDVSGNNYARERTEVNDDEDLQTTAIDEELVKSTHDSETCNVPEIAKQENIEAKEELSLKVRKESHDDCADFKGVHNKKEEQVIHDGKANPAIHTQSTIGSQSGDSTDFREREGVDEKEEGELSSSDVEKSVEECEEFQQNITKQEKAENISVRILHEKSSIRRKTTKTSTKTTTEITSDEKNKRRISASSTRRSSCELNDKAVRYESKSKLPEERRESLVDKDGRSSKKSEDKVPIKSRIIDLSKERKSEGRSSRTNERSLVQELDSSSSTKHVGTKETMKRCTRSSRKDKHTENNESEKKDNDSSRSRGRSDTREKQRKQTEKHKGSGEKTSKEQTKQRRGKGSSESNSSSKKKLDDAQETRVKRTGRGSSQGLSRKKDIIKRSTRTSSADSGSLKDRFSSTRKEVKDRGEEARGRAKDSKITTRYSGANSKGMDRKDKGGISNEFRTSSDKIKVANISGKKKEEKKDLKRNSKVENKTSEENAERKSELKKRENSGLKSQDKSSSDRNNASLKQRDGNISEKRGDEKLPSMNDSLNKADKNNKPDHLKKEKSKPVESRDEMVKKAKSFSRKDQHGLGKKRIAQEIGDDVKSSSKDSEACFDTRSKEGSQRNINNSVELKDGGSITAESSKNQKAQTKVEKLSGKKSSGELNAEHKSGSKLEKNEKVEAVIQKRNGSIQSKTQKEKVGKSQPSAVSKADDQTKQDHKENVKKLSGKRKRELTPEGRRKTAKLETKMNAVKTKEAKLPGKVVTVRILKVDRARGKALVLKRRHVNQLFIRGDNIIMVAYDNLQATEVKI